MRRIRVVICARAIVHVQDAEEEEEDDEEDVVDDMPAIPKHYATKGPRQSVSAEAYGVWNQKKEFTPKACASRNGTSVDAHACHA